MVMKRSNATLLLVILLVFTVIAWGGLFKNKATDEKNYKNYIEMADRSMEKGIYIDAVDNYTLALNLDSKNYDLAMKLVTAYDSLGDTQGLMSACDKAISIDSKNIQPYEIKINYYISKAQYAKAIKVLNSAEHVSDKDKLSELSVLLHTKFSEKYLGYSQISDWHVQTDLDYVAISENDKWGMSKNDGTKKIKVQYDYMGAYSSDEAVIPCCLNGEYYYIDKDGNKKLVGDKEYQFLGSFGSGYAPAQLNNFYGYINRNFDEFDFKYEYAGAFSNDVAAVKKDGKWALINNKFKNITEFEYDNIKVNDYGYCFEFGYAVAQKNDKYYLLDKNGKTVFKGDFDDMKLPASEDGAVAVKTGDKWGYINNDGSVLIEAAYDDAYSFSLGFAPVKMNDRWAYIDTNNTAITEFKFFEARPFSSTGAAIVKSVANWNIIVLCEYE